MASNTDHIAGQHRQATGSNFRIFRAQFTSLSLLILLGWMSFCGAPLASGVKPVAQSNYQSALQQASIHLPPGSQVAAIVRDASGNDLLAFNSEHLLTPASTLKLLTATAAYHQLGLDFRFRTQLLQRENDLIVRFSGDPLFDREDLSRLLATGIAAGMPTTVRNIYLDGSLFNGHNWSDAQSWDNRNTCFAAPAAAISLDHNCFEAAVTTGKVGQLINVSTPKALPVVIDSHASIVSQATRKQQFCRLELRHQQRGLYELHGCASPEQLPMALKVAVVDPSYYTRSLLQDISDQLGLHITGSIREAKPPSPGRLVAEHQSATLTSYLQRMLQLSDNQVADALFKTLGGDFFAVPGNYRNGAAAARQLLKNRAGIDLGYSYIADGSGLSPHNQLSVTQLTHILAHIASLPDRVIMDALPVSGVNGTLRYRYGFGKAPLRGKVRAKTGHLAGHYNLAGYFTDAQQQTLSFSIFVSGYSLAKAPDLKERSRARADRFYHSFFSALELAAAPGQAAQAHLVATPDSRSGH